MPSKVDKILLSRFQDRRCKLTDEQVEEIKELYLVGYTQKEIGRKFGVCQSTIGYIVSKKSKETLRNYRLVNPQKRRSKEEAKLYMRNLRKYKNEIIEKSSKH